MLIPSSGTRNDQLNLKLDGLASGLYLGTRNLPKNYPEQKERHKIYHIKSVFSTRHEYKIPTD